MRGTDISQPSLFVCKTVADFVPKNHPLRKMRVLVDEVLKGLDGTFDAIYADTGKPSIPPERLIRASLLQILYTVRSERQLCEHIQYNLLYRWFVGLEMEDVVWDHSTFSKNRDRLLEHDVMPDFFEGVIKIARRRHLISDEHFSVDGSLIDAWASHKSFKRRDSDSDNGGSGHDFHGEERRNDTHASTTDPDAQLMRKGSGKEAKLSYGLHHLMENRNTLVVKMSVRPSADVTERNAALDLLAEKSSTKKRTVGGDKGFDTADFVEESRLMNFTPHVSQNTERRGGSAIDGRTTRCQGYKISQKIRKMIETTFAWPKQYGGLRRVAVRGLDKVTYTATFSVSVFNLLRICNLTA